MGRNERIHAKFTLDISNFVTMKGGEYFFAPSATFITALGRT